MKLRLDEDGNLEEFTARKISPNRSEINPRPDRVERGRFWFDPEIGVFSPEMSNNYPNTKSDKPCGPMIIRDIEGYRTVAGDVASNNQPVYISSRSRHRQFLKDNSYVEVGNDYDRRQVNEGRPRRQTQAQFDSERRKRREAIRHAVDLVRTGRVREHFDG